MSNSLRCKLFGNPEILLNNQLILFSFSKIDALIYYLAVTKSASRDEVAGLLWPEKNDQNAKKNLRNAIYQANKMLGIEIISSPNKAILVLNEELNLEIDVVDFLELPQSHLDLYTDEFLKGFYLKDCESYEFWMVKMRNFYEKKFLQECFKKIESDINNNELDEVEKNIQRLIYIDEFDESNYQLLMRFYQTNRRHGKVVETYYNLSNLLKIELGITPNKDTRLLYETSLEKLNEQSNKEKQRFNSLFHGRTEELQEIEVNFNCFKNNQNFYSIVISGEAGIGKSALANVALDHIQNDFLILESQCYQVEENYAFRPWKKIIDGLSEIIKETDQIEPKLWDEVILKIFPRFEDHLSEIKPIENDDRFNLSVLSEVLIDAINRISITKKMVVLFDDIQWMDRNSLDLLTSIMLHTNENVLFVMTSRNVKKENLDFFLNNLTKCGLIKEVRLNPFSFDETQEFICKKISSDAITPELIQNVYRHTEGNLFFLIEYITLLQSNSNLNTMTVKMKDALKNRFLYLTEEEQILVNFVSYFYDYTLLDDLVYLLEKDSLDIINLMESLIEKNILKELNINGEIGMTFTHIKLREFIYLNQSIGKKRIIHNKIAGYLESKLASDSIDSLLYDNISYHYRKGNNPLKELEYKLKYLEKYLSFYHELFPVDIQGDDSGTDNLRFNQEQVFKQFDKIKNSLKTLDAKSENHETLAILEHQYLYLEGRYLIRYGEYSEGVSDIKKVIAQSKDLKDSTYLLDGYKQMIYYYIQIDAPEKMIEYIELALDLSIKENNHQSIGVLLRLKGLYYIMSGNNIVAEKLLKESINTFMLTKEIADKYAVNIAAAYNYLGEIRFNENHFSESYDMFLKAIELCSDKNSLSSLSVFYTNAGAALFAQGKLSESKEYLLKSREIYQELKTFWKRPRLDAYLAMIYLEEKNEKEIKYYLEKGKEFAERMGNNRDIGIVEFAKAVVSKGLVANGERLEDWSDWLKRSPEEYAKNAIDHLNRYQDTYEINLLKEKFDF
uniref:Bacterial transcriptional activator domain-containing protein n=1 Tax=Vagococcus carniphilus TaxID=218144 RepID=A0A430B7D4_9ENTE|nr:AAA family ATPase [Vagococcus carniphilus]QNN72316.1 AAA family ATPase [Vagococcus carniphilus]RSU16236.1 hypothetical protein CBF28_04675 [Vagococcus carniphilus]